MNIKLTTKNMAYMAMFAAMQIVLEYCTKIYEMPKGGNCAFSLVAIILCGYLMNWGYSLIFSCLFRTSFCVRSCYILWSFIGNL